jgi:hypothetical protein
METIVAESRRKGVDLETLVAELRGDLYETLTALKMEDNRRIAELRRNGALDRDPPMAM